MAYIPAFFFSSCRSLWWRISRDWLKYVLLFSMTFCITVFFNTSSFTYLLINCFIHLILFSIDFLHHLVYFLSFSKNCIFSLFVLSSSPVQSKINPYAVPGYDGYNITTYPKTLGANFYWFISWVCTTVTMNYVVQVDTSTFSFCNIWHSDFLLLS